MATPVSNSVSPSGDVFIDGLKSVLVNLLVPIILSSY